MKFRSAPALFTGVLTAIAIIAAVRVAVPPACAVRAAVSAQAPTAIAIDYPLQDSVFPHEITAPTFLWHDASSATRWIIEVRFAGHSDMLRIDAAGTLLRRGAIDPDAGPGIDLTPEQASTHTWVPDAEIWSQIKRSSVSAPASIKISGFAGANIPVSSGSVRITTSRDPVGAPIFYRDVPLLVTPPGEKGPIQPLPKAAIPLIKWQVRDVGEAQSHVVMEKLHTCANCHSFSRDGKTLGLDLDGPRNDKGLYALVPVEKQMAITNRDVIRWSSFAVDTTARSTEATVKRFGFMSQVSPDGQYVVTSIGTPDNTEKNKDKIPGFANGLLDRLFSTNYKDFRFLQVFYPTRGILAWYDRQAQQLRPLPGADDPSFVQTSAFWSPDGKYLIFSRAKARDPYPPGAPRPEYANDPKEPQIRYDLYKIPFNGGRGGRAIPVLGASNNGMSNDFPKVSPDGKWIVFVQNKTGLLMRPDSKLYMVPFGGGKARLMTCNTSLMNSWHSFSPNGRWLVFSSKARTPYTRLMLTHIDANGNDSPAILLDNTTAANRAANIPEFVNIPPGGLAKIDPQAMEFYRLVDLAYDQAQAKQIPEAIDTLRQALTRDPNDAMAHYNLATLLSGQRAESQAVVEYRQASTLSPENTLFLQHLAVSLAITGDRNGAVDAMERAVALVPASAEYRFNLGFLLASGGDYAAALPPLQKAVELNEARNWRFLAELAKVYDKLGRTAEAVQAAQQSVDLAVAGHDEALAQTLRQAMNEYQGHDAQGAPR